jgi:hypothetical protein
MIWIRKKIRERRIRRRGRGGEERRGRGARLSLDFGSCVRPGEMR